MSSCEKCAHLSTEDCGDDWGSHPYDVCNKFPGYQNLKSFPFKKDMDCFQLDFWFSEFAHDVDDTDESYHNAINNFKKKYCDKGGSIEHINKK